MKEHIPAYTILVVDDEAEIHELISRHLRFLGYKVIIASHGQEALELMQKNKVDIIISDILLPVMNGIELLKVVRKEYPMVPVIMITGYVNQENVMSCMRYGAQTCIFKPWPDMTEMEDCIAGSIHSIKTWKHKLHELHDMKPTAEFIDESEQALSDLDALFLKIEKNPLDLDSINAIFRTIHSIKGNAASLGLLKTKQLAHHSETILDAIRNRQFQPTVQTINTLLEVVDELKAIMVRLRRKQKEVENPEQFQALMQKVIMVTQGMSVPVSETSNPSGLAASLPAKTPDVEENTLHRMVRINETALDELSMLVDDLLKLHSDAIGTSSPSENKNLELLTRLHNGFMVLRKLPIQTLFQKMPRMIRDICTATGKKASLTITGGSISISRGIIQALDSPLMHILLNAVDHGAETPEERVKLGKKPECDIRIEAIQLPGEIALRISDDGRGIDSKALLAKALKRGIISPGQNITPQDAINLIFVPGLSSADKVTEISGRGVGMDIVKRNLELIGGKIEISSKPGHGTQFIIIVPNP